MQFTDTLRKTDLPRSATSESDAAAIQYQGGLWRRHFRFRSPTRATGRDICVDGAEREA